ncbi:MAG: ECF transporter S component, partial [Clostridium butyricum]
VGIGSTLGFAITGLPIVVVARAATHIIVGYIGAKIIIKNRSYAQAVLITAPIHGFLEMIVAIPFIGLALNWALIVTLVGSIMHHMVDGIIAYAIVKAVAKSRNKDIYGAFGEFTTQQTC